MPHIEANGVSLHIATQGDGGTPTLLLHELGGSGDSWARMVPHLTPTRQVLVPDLRWAGRSEKPLAPAGIETIADDLAGVLDAMEIPAVDVIGAALGSLVGAVLALRHPTRVRRLMMSAVSDELGGRTAEYLATRAERVRAVGMRAVADASLANAFPAGHEPARAAYRGIYLANDPAAYAELSMALARLRMGPARWGAIAVPTLVSSGAHDFIWPPAHGAQVAALVPGARFEVLPDAGHFPHLQSPDAMAGLATAFFA